MMQPVEMTPSRARSGWNPVTMNQITPARPTTSARFDACRSPMFNGFHIAHHLCSPFVFGRVAS